jgi:hypothetical protein
VIQLNTVKVKLLMLVVHLAAIPVGIVFASWLVDAVS